MCGIVGILARGTAIPVGVLDRVTQSLSHRGPDDCGTTVIREAGQPSLEVGLGNRRLAILDLSSQGHQPMHDEGSGNWIVYNGEIYNYREIREKLEKQGARFSGKSDTEVLLKAYGRWGEACLSELRGMFAFAIWDAHRHRLFLARDPMGIKPLYYCVRDQYFLFASEIRTLLASGLVARKLEPAGLINYLAFGSTCDPITLVQDIFALQPGHWLVWEKGRLHDSMYWDLVDGDEQAHRPASAPVTNQEQKNLEKELHEELRRAVGMQLVSDVPAGVFLSGGIDSSSLVAILRSAAPRLNTFSVVFGETEFSEAEHSRAIACKFATDHHEIVVSEGHALDAVPGAIGAMDQPSIDGINTYLIAERVRAAGVKVALSGLGGDEIFAGYSSFRTVPRMEHFARLWKHAPEIARRPLGSVFSALAPSNDQNRKLAALVSENGTLVHPYFLSRMLFTARERGRLLSGEEAQAGLRANSLCRAVLARTHTLDPINRVSYLESRWYMANMLLRDSDCMSMAHGLEVRVPLIDHQLAKKVLSLPGRWKVNGGIPKPLLMGALGDALPEQTVRRPKQGFTLPFERWLRGQLRPCVENTLRKAGQGPLATVLNPAGVGRIWQDYLDGRTSWSRPWSLFVLQRWSELHL